MHFDCISHGFLPWYEVKVNKALLRTCVQHVWSNNLHSHTSAPSRSMRCSNSLYGSSSWLPDVLVFMDRDVWHMQMDSIRNRIIRINLMMSIASFSLLLASVPAALFGMNLHSGMEQHPTLFYYVVGTSIASTIVLSFVLYGYYRFWPSRRHRQRLRDIAAIRSASCFDIFHGCKKWHHLHHFLHDYGKCSFYGLEPNMLKRPHKTDRLLLDSLAWSQYFFVLHQRPFHQQLVPIRYGLYVFGSCTQVSLEGKVVII